MSLLEDLRHSTREERKNERKRTTSRDRKSKLRKFLIESPYEERPTSGLEGGVHEEETVRKPNASEKQGHSIIVFDELQA